MIQNGVQEAEAILVGQIQNGVDHREVHSALERAVIGDLLLEDAQKGRSRRMKKNLSLWTHDENGLDYCRLWQSEH